MSRVDARDTRIEDYTYELPEEKIARYPLKNRGDARQLHYRSGRIEEAPFSNLPDRLPPETLLVGNQTRVIHARLYFPLSEGKRPIEIFCLDPLFPADYARSLGSLDTVSWKCLVGGNRRWKSGSLQLEVEVGGQPLTLYAERGERTENAFEISFHWDSELPVSFGEVIAAAGTIPLPPYLNREAEPADRDRYQTVFARQEGSVAAPTAGLHFTPEILAGLQEKGIDWAELTLHVGAGTFKPVTTPTLGDHVMHREYFTVGLNFLKRIAAQLEGGRPIVSVGTTSMRCLESLYYYGAILVRQGKLEPELDQWVASDASLHGVDVAPAFSALIARLKEEGRHDFSGYTQLLLTPGVRPRVVDGLITNFHQPRSTLLLLVAAMVGEDWRKIYDYALAHDFRFLSYGDSSLLWHSQGVS